MPLAGVTFLFLFFPLSLLLYTLLPGRVKGSAMLLCGMVFYAWGDLSNLLLLPILTYLAYLTGKQIGTAGEGRSTRKMMLGIGVALDLLTLLLFKYSVEIFSVLPFDGKLFTLGMEVPLGLGFFTLRMVGYQVDVYRDEGKRAASFGEFLQYAFFFPILTAGPVLSYTQWREGSGKKQGGFSLFTIGLAQKVLLADEAMTLFHQTMDSDYYSVPVATAWMALFLGFFGLYFEFAGYLNMGAGLCRLFGVGADPLTAGPFSGGSIGRDLCGVNGHLSRWFAAYFYLPLINAGIARWLALLLTGAAAGLFFGGRVTCLAFGLFTGACLALESIPPGGLERAPTALSYLAAVLLLPIGALLFHFRGLSDLADFLKTLSGLSGNHFLDTYTYAYARSALPVLIACLLFSSGTLKGLFRKLAGKAPVPAKALSLAFTLLLFVLCIVALMESGSSAFRFVRL